MFLFQKKTFYAKINKFIYLKKKKKKNYLKI